MLKKYMWPIINRIINEVVRKGEICPNTVNFYHHKDFISIKLQKMNEFIKIKLICPLKTTKDRF